MALRDLTVISSNRSTWPPCWESGSERTTPTRRRSAEIRRPPDTTDPRRPHAAQKTRSAATERAAACSTELMTILQPREGSRPDGVLCT